MKVNIEVEYKGKAVTLEDVEVDDGADWDTIADDFTADCTLLITNAETGEEII